MSSDLDLPVLMSADHIRRREFVAVRRGYDPTQVREFLEHVAEQIEQMESMLRESRMEAEAAMRPSSSRPDPYAQLAGRVASVLQAADEAAERVRHEALADAERILREARDDAERILREARSQADEQRTAADNALRDAREKADRTIAGLTTRREALIEQLAAMQERLVGVARELESTIGHEERAPEGDLPEGAVWAIPQGQPRSTEGRPSAGADAEAEPDASQPDQRSTIVLGQPEEPAGVPDRAAGDAADGEEDNGLEGSADELWEGTETISLDIPDIPALDLDWDDLGSGSDRSERDP